MERSLLKQSIEEWQELYVKARDSLILREFDIPKPSYDFAVTLIGLRRSGKTHLSFQITKDITASKVLYYNFEDPLFYSYNNIENLDLLLSVAQEYREDKIEYLILDEIHVVDAWERWLRKLIDQKKYKIIVTGSSAKMLSSELATSLTGRTLEYRISPLSIQEIIKFKRAQPKSKNEFLSIIREALKWGGLPEVVKIETSQKARLLQQYLNDIILKDVISRNQIRNKRALDQILTYYLTNISSLHSYNALSKAFGFDVVTASEYTQMLKEAFLIDEVYRYHPNLKVQSRDPKKVYLSDLGFRTVGARSVSDDTGKLLENLIFIELKRRNLDVWYYRGKQEVDFVVVENYKPKEIFQVCSSNLQDQKTWEREIKATEEAMDALSLKQGVILSYDREEKIKQSGKEISIVPAYKWLGGERKNLEFDF